MILFRVIRVFSEYDDYQDVWIDKDVIHGIYIKPESAVKVMKQLREENPGNYRVEVIETDDEIPI